VDHDLTDHALVGVTTHLVSNQTIRSELGGVYVSLEIVVEDCHLVCVEGGIRKAQVSSALSRVLDYGVGPPERVREDVNAGGGKV
jgi:hypothetical protein